MRFASPTSRSRLKLRIAWLDILWALAAPILAVALRDPSLLVGDRGDPTSIFIFIAVAFVAGLLSLIAFRVSDGMRHVFTVHDLLAVAGAVGLSVALTSVIMFTFTRLDGVPRSTPAIYAMVFGGGLILLRALLRAYWGDQSRRRASAEPELLRNVLVVGADRFAVGIAELMASQTPRTARVARAAVLVVREMPYVEAARAVGASHLRILLTHVLPNGLTPLIVQLSYIFAIAILAEAVLSFIGVGPPPPAPTFGNIIADGRDFIQEAAWICLYPGLAIATAVLGLNLIGDGLRDALDPRKVL